MQILPAVIAVFLGLALLAALGLGAYWVIAWVVGLFGTGATRRPLPLRGEWLAEICIVGGISRVEAPGFLLDAQRGELLPAARSQRH